MTSVRLAARPRIPRPSGITGALLTAGIFLFAGSMLTILLAIAIWPGEVKLVAPLFCDAAQPDPFVVADTYSPRPGETTTNFTLYCMGPNGDATDHGFAGPFLATMALNTGLLVAFSLLMRVIRRLRNRPAAVAEPPPQRAAPGSTAGPFVD